MTDKEFGALFHAYCSHIERTQNAEIDRMISKLAIYGCKGTITRRDGKKIKIDETTV